MRGTLVPVLGVKLEQGKERAQRKRGKGKMFTEYDRKQVNRMLEKAQMYLQPFRTQSQELQDMWQETVQLQVRLDRIPVEEEPLKERG